MKSTFVRYLVLVCCLTVLLTVSAFAYDIQGGIVDVSSSLNMRQQPNTSCKVIAKLYDGDRVAVIGESGSFYKVCYEGTIGYLHSDYVDVQDVMNVEAGSVRINVDSLNMRSGPSTSYKVLTSLSEGTVAKVIGINNGWYKIEYRGQKGYVSGYHGYVELGSFKTTTAAAQAPAATPAPAAPAVSTSEAQLRQQICDYAATFLGVPYLWGGTTPNGFDCSGLVQYVYNHFGIKIARVSYDQYHSSVKKISKSQLQPGDLVFFTRPDTGNKVGHVGIYVGNDTFIHAPRSGKNVEYTRLSNSYYVANYVGSGTMFK
jgi:cell wall-associated NlpC family hydrolase